MAKVIIFNNTASKIYFKGGEIKAKAHTSVEAEIANKLTKMYKYLEVIKTEEEKSEESVRIEDALVTEIPASKEEDPFEDGDVGAKPVDPKEYRKSLLKRAKDLGLNLAKNVTTAELEKFIAAAEEARAE